ncbi:MAG: ornithine carbamoyltransferase [Lachnospiraceae bacterium]|nr:ornithine carbamoyltransferase [Lachnospiraceae bacterium]
MGLKGKSFLKLLDQSAEDIEYILDLAAELKKKKKEGITHRLCEGKNIALIFEKTSTRTRCAFEVAAADLGMHAVYLSPNSYQMGNKESVEDTARVMGRMFDGIEYRGFEQSLVEELAEFSGIPVWNGLTNESHPTQVMADFLTIKERFGYLKGIKLVYLGDARYNMGNSMLVGCAKMGVHCTISAPQKYLPAHDLVEKCREMAKISGGSIEFIEDPKEAVKGRNVVYTDVWVSMGEPPEVWDERFRDLYGYQVNKELMALADENAVFMHCLPSFHDRKTNMGGDMCERYGVDSLEVTDDVFKGPQSIVFDEAENRLHTIKAIMAATLM